MISERDTPEPDCQTVRISGTASKLKHYLLTAKF